MMRRRSLATAVGLMTVAGFAVPFAIGNAASGGGASAQAVFFRSTSAATGTDIESSTPLVDAPAVPGMNSSDTGVGAGSDSSPATLRTTAVSAFARNAADSYSAQSWIDGLQFTIAGVPIMTAGELAVSTTCVFGQPGAATITTNDVTVAGNAVPAFDVPSYSERIPLPDGSTVTVSFTQVSSVGNEGAAAQALRMHYAVSDSASNDTSSADVVLAAASCQAPTAPATPDVVAMTPTSGPTAGGTTVTLAGTGLDDATAVNVCDVAVTDFDVGGKGTSLTFVTPPCDAGPQAVSVTGSVTTVTVPDAFSYIAPDTASTPTAAEQATLSGIAPTQGSTQGGTPVKLSGTSLGSAASVSICGADVTELEIAADGSSVTFATPPCEPGAVPVAVGFGDGSTLAAPQEFTYVAPDDGAQTAADTASITGMSPASGPVAGGTALVIEGSRLDGATGVTICRTSASDLNVSPDGTRIAVTTPRCTAGPRIPVVTFSDGSVRAAARTFGYVAAVVAGEAASGASVSHVPASGLAGSDMLPHTGTSTARVAVPGLVAIALGLTLVARRRRRAER